MHALSHSRAYNSIQEQNQQEWSAKNSLYELAEAEDRLNLQITYRRSPLLAYKMDSIDEWGNVAHSNTKSNNYVSRAGNLSKISRQAIQNRKGFFDSQVLPKLKKDIIKNDSNPKCNFFEQTTIQSKKSMTLSVNDIFQSKVSRMSILRQRKFSQTPNLQIAKQLPPRINCKDQDLAWYVARKPLKKQKSFSNNGSKTIKKQKQSLKQNYQPPSKTLLLKQIHKLRNDWMELQKMKNLKKKNKLDYCEYPVNF